MEAEGAFFNTSDYELKTKKIGEGSYGTVYVAKNIKDNQKYAAKLINIENGFDGLEQMQFLRESLILHQLDHPSIVKFKGINFKSFSDNKLLQPTIITEYLPHGSLKDNLNKEKQALSDIEWTATKKMINLLGISDALRYLHEQGITHRDLKPENILIDSNYYPRVCDFGLSKCFSDSLTRSMKLTISKQFGTPLYLPPEILRGEDSYDSSVDVYAFGLIAYEIVTGNQPFSELGQISPYLLINKIINGYRPKFNKFATERMKNLIRRCWIDSPKERPTFKEIFDELSSQKNSFFTETIDETEIEDYLDEINEKRKSQPPPRKSSNNVAKELNELKSKIKQLQHEHDILFPSDHVFQLGLVDLLEDNKKRRLGSSLIELKKSSLEGNRYASFIVGLLYEVGNEISQNIEESFKYYELSSKQGNPSGLRRIGLCYCRGRGVKQDFSKAKEYYEKAVELGDVIALNNLGVLYKNGQGVEQDYKKAKEYYEKAAELGNSLAMYSLGTIYKNGRGVEQDYNKAKEYYEKAAELGDASALNSLGILYKNGQGVEQDYNKAIEYYEKAAELGNSNAMYNLGFLYENGQGVEQDYNKAKEYYEKSAKLGNEDANKQLQNL